jgi:NAD(P)-dependent dehydrogenase (short-subunit alcohol dehydrogenase family)
MQSFAGQVVLITGAASGIGRLVATMLHREGAKIAAIDLRSAPLESLAQELGGERIGWRVADVTNSVELHKASMELAQGLGPVDILFASAGIGIETSALNMNSAEFTAVISVNLVGVANSIAAVLPGMLERRRGHLVAMSSLASFRGVPRLIAYCASKAGVSSLMEGIRLEVASHGIATTTICPGFIRTPMTDAWGIPPTKLMELPYAAERIVDAIRRRTTYVAFPRGLRMFLSLLRWLPCGMSDWLTMQMVKRFPKVEKEPRPQ